MSSAPFLDSGRPQVRLPQGTLIGTTLDEKLPKLLEAFLGVPYAVPPVGDRRFRRAQPIGPSAEVFDASKYGPCSPGKQLKPEPKLRTSEDCLTANVFRQAGTTSADKLLPVLIYVHGGGYNQGSATMYNTPSLLSYSAAPFVAVSFNYRLGALGFLPSAITAKEGVLNLGLWDQHLLFEWVRDNIAAFGGDPNCVTLVGLSAGAHSIGHHLLHYKNGVPGLFHRVVLESGAPTSRAVRPYDAPIHKEHFQAFLREVGAPATLPDDEIFPFLRKLPSDVVTEAEMRVYDQYENSLRWAFQPVIEGDFIPRPPLYSWKLGQWHKVPIMTGFNGNEGSMYVDQQMDTSAAFIDFFHVLLPLLTKEDLATLDKLYPDPATNPDSIYQETRNGLGSQYKRVEAAYGHYAYVAPVRQTVELASGGVADYGYVSDKPLPPVYLYHWALIRTEVGGAMHADNMDYEVYDESVVKISPAQKELAGTIHAYLTSFIATGDPNAVPGRYFKRAKWEPYTQDAPKALLYAEGNEELVGGDVGVTAQLVDDTWARKETKFWWSKVGVSQQ